MATLKIKLTSEMISLLKWINISEVPIIEIDEENREEALENTLYYRSPFGGEFIYEDMAMILGYQDNIISGTEEDPDGAKYDEDKMKIMSETYLYIVENFREIEEIIHQFIQKEVKPGLYVAKTEARFWTYKEEEK